MKNVDSRAGSGAAAGFRLDTTHSSAYGVPRIHCNTLWRFSNVRIPSLPLEILSGGRVGSVQPPEVANPNNSESLFEKIVSCS